MTNKEWALLYWSRGWSIVPIEIGSKMPAIPWVKYQNVRMGRSEVESWWTEHPEHGIGVITGKISDLVVVDIDVGRGGNLSDVISKAPTDVISQTGSGGYHCFYSYPQNSDRIPNSVGESGIDIRGDGGFIVLPPSIHYSGNAYTWEKNTSLSEFDTHLFITKKVEEITRTENWLSTALSGIAEGGRNQTCARLSGYFIAKSIPVDVVESFIMVWNRGNTPPMPEYEIRRTVQSVYAGHIRANTALNEMTENAVEEMPYMGLVPLADYMLKFGGEKVEWTVESWLPKATIAFVIAPPGSYKTWLTLDLAVSVATGEKFLGNFTVVNKSPVLIYQQEDSHYGLAERLGVIMKSKFGIDNYESSGDSFSMPAPKTDIPIFFHTERQLRIDNAESVFALKEQIKKTKAKLVIIDPLYSAASMEDYMATAAQHLLHLKGIRDELGVTFLIVHHTGKGKDEKNRERLWGSQFLNAALETGWQVSKSADTSIVVHRHYKVKGLPDTIGVSFDVSTDAEQERYNVSFFNPDENKEIDELKKPTEAIITLLRNAKAPLSQIQIAEALGVHRTTASRRIDKLVASGELRMEDNGSLSLYI